MEKEYLNALLSDIEKSVIPDEKINLLAILVTDLAKSHENQNEVIESLTAVTKTTANALDAWVKASEVMGEAVVKTRDALVVVSQNLSDLSETVLRMAERENQQAKMTLKKIESDTDSYEKVHNAINKLYEHIDQVADRITRTVK